MPYLKVKALLKRTPISPSHWPQFNGVVCVCFVYACLLARLKSLLACPVPSTGQFGRPPPRSLAATLMHAHSLIEIIGQEVLRGDGVENAGKSRGHRGGLLCASMQRMTMPLPLELPWSGPGGSVHGIGARVCLLHMTVQLQLQLQLQPDAPRSGRPNNK